MRLLRIIAFETALTLTTELSLSAVTFGSFVIPSGSTPMYEHSRTKLSAPEIGVIACPLYPVIERPRIVTPSAFTARPSTPAAPAPAPSICMRKSCGVPVVNCPQNAPS